jgi:galactose-1-phosphate uridylyltransferase
MMSAELLSPPDFQREGHSIEYREDPLTGVLCRLNARRAARPRQAPLAEGFKEIIPQPEDCPFCPQNIPTKTPLFPADICPGGRIERGESCFFPNLFPLARYHATGTLTREHFLDLPQFQERMIADNLLAAREFMLLVQRREPQARYPIYIWNHLPPSAGSIIHPHTQVWVDIRPTPYQKQLLEKSREYFTPRGSNFWKDLLQEEQRQGERYIGSSGAVTVIASYAPQGNREVQLIFREVSNLAELGEQEIEDFARCLVKLLRGYHHMGVTSFNLSTFSAPLGERLEYYSLHAKLISRPPVQPYYRNDTGFLERLHYEADIELAPERVAQELRPLFAE